MGLIIIDHKPELSMSHIKLEIKFASLAAEARIIRRKERSLRKWKKYKEIQARAEQYPITIKSKVANRNYNPEMRHSLREHRLKVVRPSARAAHLALAYIKGVPYRVVERLAFTSPDWRKVWDNITRFSDKQDPQGFKDWADAKLDVGPPHGDNSRRDYTATYSYMDSYTPPSKMMKWK